jgi:uncharacterized delta-60 repeat protein
MQRLFTCFCLCILSLLSFAQIPPLDPDFTGRYNDVITLPGGKYVAVGFLTRSYLGEVTGGTVISSNIPGFPAGNYIPMDIDRALAAQADGKILVTGTSGTVRLNPDGSLDNSFINNGLGGVDVKVNCQGKIFIASSSSITQLSSDGSIAVSFGENGSVNAGFQINYLLLQCDGKIIAVGANNLVRYDASGVIDDSFQPAMPLGIANFGRPSLQSDGKIVIPGIVSALPYGSNISLLRLNANGSADGTFSADGITSIDFGGWAIGTAIQDDGKIVVCFGISSGGSPWTLYYYGLVRFNTDGTQDLNFPNSNMGIYISPYVIKPHAVATGANQIYVAAEQINYPVDKRQPVLEFPYLGQHVTEAASALPVAYKEFKIRTNGLSNVLDWKTATENNNSGFEVQYSRDAAQFSPLGFVTTKAIDGNSASELSYSFVHNYSALRPGQIYYRLKQTDINGQFKYSSILSSTIKSQDFLIYPNPAKDKITLSLNNPEKFMFSIIDNLGRTVKAGQLKANVLNISDLPMGTFVLKVWSDGTIRVYQFVKE